MLGRLNANKSRHREPLLRERRRDPVNIFFIFQKNSLLLLDHYASCGGS
jgi:hypothetical protein